MKDLKNYKKYLNFISKNIFQPIRNFVFPQICFSCDEILNEDEKRICEKCWSGINFVEKESYTIKILKSRFENIIDDFFTLYYFEHGGILQSLAHNMKYESISIFGEEFGKKLAKVIPIEIINSIDGIIPMPIHKIKFRERGYNQSDFIAKGITQVHKISIKKNIVFRGKNTVSQTKLNLSERKENVANAFFINPKMDKLIENKNYLIVDDVVTTGSTVIECAKILKNSGAKKVFVASVAIAKLDKNENPSVN